MIDAENTLEPKEAATETGVPRRLGPYRIDGVLGRGGMGEVFRAWDEALQRPVAIKRVAGALRGQAESRARFWREARALAALDHPGVVRVHRIDETADGDLYLAMELVVGPSLAERVAAPWPSACAAAVGRQVAAALAAVHGAGMTHRDVKPANILVQNDGAVRLVDFGLARRSEGLEDRVTATGARLGTPAYMAPEQVDGGEVGPAADIFSLGVVLYRLVAGVHPFTRDSAAATALALASAVHRPLMEAAPLADPALARVIERCLLREAPARWADGAALSSALVGVEASDRAALAACVADQAPATDGLASSAPPPASVSLPSARSDAPSRLRWLVAVVVVVVAAGLSWWTAGPAPQPPAAPAARAPAPPLPALPPHPVIAVAGFAAPGDDPQDPRAAVLADALRHALEQAPDAVISLPLAALEGALAPGQSVGPDLDPKLLARRTRGPGHVDLLVRGTLSDADEGVVVEVELVDPATGEVRRSYRVQGPADPLVAAGILARALLGILEAEQPKTYLIPTTSVSAYGALLVGKAALRAGNFEVAEANLEWALQLDPTFVLGRLERLRLLRSRRQMAEVLQETTALLARDDLTERERALVGVWQALGAEEGPTALQRLDVLLARWPCDLEVMDLLMVLRAQDPEVRDLEALAQVARRVLAIAPRHEGAASRLVRALAFRGQVAAAEGVLADLGISSEDPEFIEVFGEMDLYAGRYDEAARRFAAAVARSPEDIYSEHMGFATDILRDHCEEAAVAALQRIQRIEALGREGNLDWTYSLASQALLCRGQWVALNELLTRWEKHSDSGRIQVRALRPRVALAAGEAPDQVAQRVRALLADGSPDARPELVVTLGRASDDPGEWAHLAAEAEAAAVAAGTLPSARGAWLSAHNLLKFKMKMSSDPTAVPGPGPDQASVREEGDLLGFAQSLAFRAEVLAEAGKPAAAQAAWSQLKHLGYPRLYATDFWRMASVH